MPLTYLKFRKWLGKNINGSLSLTAMSVLGTFSVEANPSALASLSIGLLPTHPLSYAREVETGSGVSSSPGIGPGSGFPL